MKLFHKLLTIILLAAPLAASAQIGVIVGATTVNAGNQVTYSFQNDYMVFSPTWTITNGTVMWTTEDQVNMYYEVSVYWGTAGSGSVVFKDGSSPLDSKTITINGLPQPPAVVNGSRCGTGTVALSATAGSGGNTVRWYSAPTAGTLLATATGYTTPSISTSTTYYATTYNTTSGFESSPRTAVTATVNAVPSAPSVTPQARCGTGSVTLTATAGSGGTLVRWYSASAGGTLLATTTSYATPSISTTTTYYAVTYNSTTGCESTPRTAVAATINALPAAATSSGGSRCGTGAVALTATAGSGGTTVRWYNASTGGTLLATAANYTTPSISATTTYYISSYNSATGCETSTRTAVTATINSVPSAPGATGNARFGSGTLTLAGTGTPSGGTYKWYNPSNALLATGATYVTPSISTSQSNYVYVKALSTAGCEGAATWVNVTITPVPVVTAPASRTVMGSNVTLDGGAGYTTYTWKNAANVTVGNSQQLTTNVPDYYTVTVTKTGTPGSSTSTPFHLLAQLEDIDMNYIVTNVVQVSNVKNLADIDPLPAEAHAQSVQYFDGLGRPLQTVTTQGSPDKKDVVQPFAYDAAGREAFKYLPFATTENSGLYKANPLGTSSYTGSAHYNFYQAAADDVVNDTRPFSETIFEASPLNRPDKEFGPGSDWYANNKAIDMVYTNYVYGTGSCNEKVIAWKVNGTVPVRNTASSLNGGSGYYPSNALVLKNYKDEDGHETREFYDKAGRLILKKVQLAAAITCLHDPAQWAQTYYVYDDLGLLRFVLQPDLVVALAALDAAHPNAAPDATQLDNFVFQYTYDARRRQVQSKVPGALPLYKVYDARDRLVMTQDGNQRNVTGTKEWTFIKYDALNRPVLIGIYYNNGSLATLQTTVDNFYNNLTGSTAWHETYVGAGGVVLGYDNKSFPQVSTEANYLTANYYDKYDSYVEPAGYTYLNESISGQETAHHNYPRGQLAAMRVRNLESNAWLRTVNHYDRKLRLIQTVADHQKGTLRISTIFDFTAKPVASRRTYVVNSVTTTVNEATQYDHAGRVNSVSHGVNGAATTMLASNNYNAVGQLIDKGLHSTDGGSTVKQSVDYGYTIRGWVNRINNADVSNLEAGDAAHDYFGMELAYNNALAGTSATPAYNGNISAMQWSTGGNGASQRQAYRFAYDALNRLTAADHKDYDVLQAGWVDNGNAYSEALTYSHNGNITTLQRRGLAGALIDNLTYTYAGNKLNYVNDTGDATKGFVNGNTGTDDYWYDHNGNLTRDKNKGLNTAGDIRYNYLNLPKEIVKSASGERMTYAYDASGRKLAQKVYATNGTTLVKETDYIGEMVLEGNTLKFISHAEGRVLPNGGSWEYQYNLKDHLGNVRVTFTAAPQTADTGSTNFETGDSGYFLNYSAQTFDLVDHTDAGTAYNKVQWLTGQGNGRVGVAREVDVMPGDEVTLSAYVKYMNLGEAPNANGFINSLATAFGVSSGSTGEQLKIYNGLNSFAGTVTSGDHANDDEGAPKIFVTILFFDKEYNLLDAAWKQVTTTGAQTSPSVKQPPHDFVTITASAPAAGYAYVFVSNEHPYMVDAYFDDVSFSHTPSPVVAVNDYYPFGLGYGNWQREGSHEQRTLYNSKELQDELAVNWYDYGARMYMPEIGRWGVIDPKADRAHDLTPYRYSFNNPVMFIDPDGQWEVNVGYGQTMDHRDVSGSIDHYGGITPTERDFAQGPTATSVVDNVRQLGKEWSSHATAVYGQNAQIENVEEKFTAWVANMFGETETKPVDGSPQEKTWYTGLHTKKYDIVREHEIKRNRLGYTETTRVVTITYGEGRTHKIETYGYQVKTYYEYGTVEQWEKSPYIKRGYGVLDERAKPELMDQIHMAVNNHLFCDCYTDWLYYTKNRLKAVSSVHR